MNRILSGLIFLFLVACSTKEEALPILGEMVEDPESGKMVHYQAPTFQLTNQLNELVSEQTVAGKVQVVDFFFTSCPTICPQMTGNLKLVEEAFAKEEQLALLSFSIDSRHDTPERLMKYAERYDIDHQKWSLLTGDSDIIFDLAQDYKVRAFDDSSPGFDNNLFHDGTFILVDGDRHIRGYYNGLDVSDTNRLIDDIKKLLPEWKS